MTRVLVLERPIRLDPRCGRLIEHDSASLAYAYRAMGAPVTATHTRHVPIVNQGQLGSCTGQSAIGCIGTGKFYAQVKDKTKFDKAAGEDVYKRATVIDEFRGTYPPDDTGSSGLAVAKVLKERGLIKGYQHAVTFADALGALSERPVITGMRWFDSFNKLDANGFIQRTRTAREVGGHEFVVHAINVEGEYVTCTNSWGTNYGINGLFRMSFDLWEAQLKDRGDVTVFTPLDEPAPVPVPPTPVPPTNDADRALWDAVQTWGKTKGYV